MSGVDTTLAADGRLGSARPARTKYASRIGHRPMKDPFVPFSARIAQHPKDKVERHAAEQGVTMNDVTMRALDAYFKRPRRTVAWPRVTVAPRVR